VINNVNKNIMHIVIIFFITLYIFEACIISTFLIIEHRIVIKEYIILKIHELWDAEI
jgi:hypothetical protein